MLGAWLRHLLRACRRAWVRAWAWLGRLPGRVAKAAFTLVCWLIVALLLGSMFVQLLHDRGNTDPKVLAALLAAILPAAFLGAYGREVASRIKKLGPFELFEIGKATGYLEDLSALEFDRRFDVATTLTPDQHGEIRLGRSRFTEKQSFAFERGDRYLNYLEYSGSEPTQGRQQTEHWKQLFTIGFSAFSIGEWTKAIHWLERLEELSRRSFEPARVDFYVGMAHVFSFVEGSVGDEVREPVDLKWKHARRAEERLGHLAREQSLLEHLGYFWLAYVQDELGHWYEAAQSNEAALKRRPRYAPSKYNAAVSRAKLGQYRHAYRMLASIAPEDQYAKDIFGKAEGDAELWDAVKDLGWQRRMLYVVRRGRDLAPDLPQDT
jgi:tetratricopeptide (TPR) repeat protein